MANPLRASADESRPIHGSVGIGTTLLITGADGDRNRFEAEVDLEPRSRFGAFAALRGFDADHKGIATAGLIFEAGAARPRLVLDFHADAGVDLDAKHPVLGGGLRTVITIVGPLGVALETGGYLSIGDVDTTRLVLATGAQLVARW